MVILILTRNGFEEAKSIIAKGDIAIWINDKILTNDELNKLRTGKINITNFTYEINPKDTTSVEGALATISEHHPEETIFVEII